MSQQKVGILNGMAAFGLWGLYPMYWWLLGNVGALEIFPHRMLWSFVTLAILTVVTRRSKAFNATLRALWADKKKLLLIFVAAMLLALNWFVFMFAVIDGRTLEASLAYYINPLLSVLLGTFFLKEKLNKYQAIAVGVAVIGVVYLTVSYGVLPWISLVLAMSFAIYGFIKKIIKIETFFGLLIETIFMLPVAVFFFTQVPAGNHSFTGTNLLYVVLLIGTGIVTISPLYFFAKATDLLELKVLGFLQYMGPSLQMLVAIFVFGEDFSLVRLISFAFIWAACLIFSLSHLLIKKEATSQKPC